MHKCIDSSLPDITTTGSPSHIDLCCFKVTILVPLQWGHQTLKCWVSYLSPFLPYMLSPYHATQVQ
jgi:hypothetical protein